VEIVVLALARPSLLVLALSVAFRRRPQPAAPAVPFGAPAAPAAGPRVTPLPAPVAGFLQEVLP
jgi:hypothetical protein